MIDKINKIKDNYIGVYFLQINEKVVYVGQSINVKNRLKNHYTDPFKVFNNFKIRYVKNKDDLSAVELKYIKYYEPIYNIKDSETIAINKLIDNKLEQLTNENIYKIDIIENQNKTENGNNFRLMGLLCQWVYGDANKLFCTSTEIAFYLYIARMNIGYGQYQTKRLSYDEIKQYCKTKSRATISKTLKSLKDKNLINKVISNKSNKQFKQAYRYELVFRQDLNFPNLGKLKGRNSIEQEEFEKFKKEKYLSSKINNF